MEMIFRVCPPIPKDLMDFLDASFPEKCADPKDSDRDLWRKVGSREVVRFLRHQFDQQQRIVYVHEQPQDAQSG